jgi:hypothetical protein
MAPNRSEHVFADGCSPMSLQYYGTVIEDVSEYSRVAMLFQRMLQTSEYCKNSGIEDGTLYQEGRADYPLPHEIPMPIYVGEPISLSLTPLLGFLQCKKLIPLRLSGGMTLIIDFASADDALAPIVDSPGRDYVIEQVTLRGATVFLDSALEASYNQLILQNKALTFACNTISTQVQTVPLGTQLSVSVVRALSRINALFVSFRGADMVNGVANNDIFKHEVLSFLNPFVAIDNAWNVNWMVQVGSKKYPEQEVTSIAESFSLLRQATGVYDSDIRTLNLTRQSYSSTNFVIGVPMQTSSGVFGSGLNTRSGDLLTVTCKNLSETGRGVGKIYLHILNEMVIELRESGVSVLD